MNKSDFDFYLPERLIAQTPLEKRDSSRLLHLDKKTGAIEHGHFHDITKYLKKGDCLVMNDSRVLPARLIGSRLSGGLVELVLLRDLGDGCWECLSRPGRKTKPGTELTFGDGELTATVMDVAVGGNRIVKFHFEGIFIEKLEKLGIACKMFAPLRPFVSTHYNYRDHRKIMVIDGKIGFTGGINLSDEYINRTSRLGHWKDTAIALRGDAVRSLTLMFLQMWDVSSVHFTPEVYSKYLDVSQPAHEKEVGYVIPYGDSPLDRDLVGEMVYMDIINRANRYVHIMTPYLIIDNEMITALTYAARRGVEVQLILPHVPDKEIAFSLAHTYYRRLLENGVQIYEYEPGFVHAKVFVSDDCKATVGTINLDYRSLYHHFECGTYLYASPEVAKIEQDFQQTLAKCVRADAELLKNDPFMRKLIGPGMRIIAPLL